MLGEELGENKSNLHETVFHDPTVPYNLSVGFADMMSYFPARSRVLHTSNFPLATFAYAISFPGAQKIL